MKLLVALILIAAAPEESPSTDPLSVGHWVLIAGGIFLILNQAASFIDRFRKKDDAVVRIESKVLTEDDLKRIDQSSKARKADSDRQIAEIRSAHSQELQRLDRQIEIIQKAGEERTSSIHKRIDDLPNKIIDLLRSAGSLKGPRG